jgi:hypothetical protein
MNPISDAVEAFFQELDRANNRFDPNLLAPLLADTLVGADPNGAVLALTKADFLAGISERRAYLSELGFRSVKTVPLEETALTDRYTMVRTHGVMQLEKTPDRRIELVHDSIYILFVRDGSPRIVFTLSHEDPKKMMHDQGSATDEPS